MKFSEVLPAFEQGSKVRRIKWLEDAFIQGWQGRTAYAEVADLLSEDWEVVVEDKKPLGSTYSLTVILPNDKYCNTCPLVRNHDTAILSFCSYIAAFLSNDREGNIIRPLTCPLKLSCTGE